MKYPTPHFRHTVLARSLLAACGATAAVVGTPASAQEAPSLQRVEITGSNIKRVGAETAAPVQTISRDDIVKSGKASVAELLQTLAVDNQGSVPTTFGNGFVRGGASGISLRGLGPSSTLVLINGRRIAPYGAADDGQKVFADLNLIPMEAVERVEILKDGASAIYGSDAIAGVVNVILRKDFKGTVASGTVGRSRYGDGTERRGSITHGFGNIDEDDYNVLFNFEMSKTDAIWNRDRIGRGQVGSSDGRGQGFDANGTIGGVSAVGSGAILGNNNSNSVSINGNVRNPTTLDYYNRGNPAGAGFTRTFPGAACSNFSKGFSQVGSGGGCLIDAPQQYGQIQPSTETLNLFGRGARKINADLQAYAEFNWFSSKSDTSTTPSSVSTSTGFPGGPVTNTGVALGSSHPDNPYFGSEARVRYLAGDVGPRTNEGKSDFVRLVTGLKGTIKEWDFDSAFLYSQTKGNEASNGYLQRDVAFALLNPTPANVAAAKANSPAYAALPAGSFWRIAENAGLNSAALYAALSPTITRTSLTKTTQVDFKANREIGRLAGGPIGVAVGAEFRNESTELTPTTGTDRGNIIGLGYSAYKGSRNVAAVYSEVLFPVLKTVELTAAVRADKYSDVGSSVTPKVGAKWSPAKNFALRGSYAQGFRAPNAAENGVGGVAAFSSATDPVRCNLGVTSACSANSVALITSPNANLKPETSQSFNLGMVWDATPSTSMSVDLWQIVRKNEINPETVNSAIAAGHVSRDPSTAAAAGDPGQITAVLTNYINSSQTTVRGLDFDGRQRIDLPSGYGKVTLDVKWTHLFTFTRKDTDGTSYDFAGTHGNCDITNCMGTPADRINFGTTWETGQWRVTGLVNYRGALKNVLFKNDPAGCASATASGADAPSGCKVSSFTTIDLNVRYKVTPKTEIYGTVRNLLDKIPPFDPLTYGAVGYNPLDYSGAVGRFFSIGARHTF